MSAALILEALHTKWPDSEYLFVTEAPEDPGRQGRKIDALVVSLWKSRGYERHAVEIKVSHSDWMREVNNPRKADWWYRHTHRFWVAVPVGIAPKVRQTLPAGWGLIACELVGDHARPSCRVVVNAEKHDPEDISWPSMIGLLRAAADSGFNALQRAEERGYRRGKERAELDAKMADPDAVAQARWEHLDEIVKAFEAKVGVELRHLHHVDGLADAVNLARTALSYPHRIEAGLGRVVADLPKIAQVVDELRAGLLLLTQIPATEVDDDG